MATRKSKNKFPKVVTSPTGANRSMNKTVYCQKTATPANRSMNAPVRVKPSK